MISDCATFLRKAQHLLQLLRFSSSRQICAGVRHLCPAGGIRVAGSSGRSSCSLHVHHTCISAPICLFSHRGSFIYPDEIVCFDASEDITLWTQLRVLDFISGASLDESIMILAAVEQICLEGASPDPNSAPFQLP